MSVPTTRESVTLREVPGASRVVAPELSCAFRWTLLALLLAAVAAAALIAGGELLAARLGGGSGGCFENASDWGIGGQNLDSEELAIVLAFLLRAAPIMSV